MWSSVFSLGLTLAVPLCRQDLADLGARGSRLQRRHERLAELIILVRDSAVPYGLERRGALLDGLRVIAQLGAQELARSGEVVEQCPLAIEHPVVVGG